MSIHVKTNFVFEDYTLDQPPLHMPLEDNELVFRLGSLKVNNRYFVIYKVGPEADTKYYLEELVGDTLSVVDEEDLYERLEKIAVDFKILPFYGLLDR